ncbi:oligosaccharide repeat unit polymerase [Streptococcus suis]|nr:oligosaccharide repeat unit polymerase [Streptococcus suis]NQJ77414.1 oligosaccharide repeat unit polymerase [Streptococcus suis]
MLLILLVLLTLFFVLFNFNFSNGDYLNPATLLSEIILLFSSMCLFYVDKYEIEFNLLTVIVLFLVQFIFSTINFFTSSTQRKKSNSHLEVTRVSEINLSKNIKLLIIIFQIIAILFFIKYIRDISFASGRGGGLFDWISNFDGLFKFKYDYFVTLGVSQSKIYSILEYPVECLGYFVTYITVNNYVYNKKIDRLNLTIILLHLVKGLLTGSRSPLFRVVTMILILYYILFNRKYGRKSGNFSTLIKIIASVLVITPLFIFVLSLMGRSTDTTDFSHYIFLYTGAPLLNLNNYLATYSTSEVSIFGEQTLRTFYGFLYGKTGFDIFKVTNIISNFSFVRSTNGIGTGNVFTAFYMFVYDWGIKGVILFTSIMAIYYVPVYKFLVNRINGVQYKFDLTLFFYAYLFNDLVMLLFSNRFFETTMRESFFRFSFVAFILYSILFTKKMKFGKYIFKLG